LAFKRLAALAVATVLVAAACGGDSGSGTTTTGGGTTTTGDAVAAAQARLDAATEALSTAKSEQEAARAQFCSDSKDYITALDRYGKLFTDSATTVGDVQTGGADLEQPRDTVQSSATEVSDSNAAVAAAEGEVADAQAALENAKATASGESTTSAPPASTTTSTVVPVATIDRVKQAETDFTQTAAGITADTPLTQATAEFNSAALALQIAWLQLFADAGCLSSEQATQAAQAITEYTVALQTELQAAGYDPGPIDGVYGPQTVAAVKKLQTDNGLPATGFVDMATALALDAAVAKAGAAAAATAQIQTVAVQTTLKLAGYWTGPVDGVWTPELTDALKAFQTALGIPATGVVDPATLVALEQAIAALTAPPETTTTTESGAETTTSAAN
jgi:peptidoglycan hydrolase-like protein with peptidoglycan-binding domain